jgi:hypothetical protein
LKAAASGNTNALNPGQNCRLALEEVKDLYLDSPGNKQPTSELEFVVKESPQVPTTTTHPRTMILFRVSRDVDGRAQQSGWWQQSSEFGHPARIFFNQTTQNREDDNMNEILSSTMPRGMPSHLLEHPTVAQSFHPDQLRDSVVPAGLPGAIRH